MLYRKQSLGRPASFLIPSLKLKQEWSDEKNVERVIEEYLLANFDGYTAAAGNIFGEWRDPITRKVFYGEHREYSVAFLGKERIPELEKFLATVAHIIDEECLYFTTGEDAWLIYPQHTSQCGHAHGNKD